MKFALAALVLATITCPVLLASNASADPVGGSRTFEDAVRPGGIDSYNFLLRREETTIFAVVGSGSSDIDCFLYDEHGGLVAKDNDDTANCVLSVAPRWTGRFVLKVVNVGDRITTYSGTAR